MKRLLSVLMLVVAIPVHAQLSSVQKWEYAMYSKLTTGPRYETNTWFAGDSTVDALSTTTLLNKLSGHWGNQAALFNWFGQQGWELVTCSSYTVGNGMSNRYECWFKRPKS